jgi:C2H2-type zinc-finger domain
MAACIVCAVNNEATPTHPKMNPLSSPNLLDLISEQNLFLSCDLSSRTEATSSNPFEFWKATGKIENHQNHLLPGDLKVFTCNRCVFRCGGNQELLNHFYSVHSKAISLPRTRSASTSQTSETVQDFACPTCAFLCSNPSSLKNHISSIHGKKFKCKECSYSCATKQTMAKHMVKIHEK